jgi:hypothetical protein
MCQADTTVLTMMWSDHSVRPIGNLTAPHECVNWDRLMEWVEPNSRDLAAEGWLVHPKFGMSTLTFETHAMESDLTNVCLTRFRSSSGQWRT